MKFFALALFLFPVVNGFAANGTPPNLCQPAPAVKAVLEKVNAAGNALDSMDDKKVAQLWLRRELDAKKIIAPIPVASVKDIAVPARNHQIPVRVYHPKPGKKLPVLVFFHGGGWSIGSIATYDSFARALAAKTPAVVVSVDYRLAPEHPYPAGLQDAQLAFEWVYRNAADLGGDPAKIGVAGDSGGGNLATVVARKSGEEGITLKLQALFYPSVNLASTEGGSFVENGTGYLLTKKSVDAFRDFYVPAKEDWKSPDVSPLLTDEAALAKLPHTYLLVVGCDPLRDEGLAYGAKLRNQNVPVDIVMKSRMVHGFLNFFNGAAAPEMAREVSPTVDEITEWLGKAFARPVAPKR